MKVLFSVRNAAYVRHYEPVLREMASRGHTVELAADGGVKERPWPASVEQIARDFPSLRLGRSPDVTFDPWFELATALRQNLFHARFLEPQYSNTPVLLTRAAEKAPGFAKALFESRLARSQLFRRVLTAALRMVERSTPVPRTLNDYLKHTRPDVVVFTPLVVLRTSQLDLLRAARQLGIPTVFAVASWDHLSSKGLLYDVPDRVVVWNQTQSDEAVRLHRVPADRVVVTGAQVFDEWFDRQPSTTRGEFCARVGLDPALPFVFYVGSALFEGSPSEPEFAMRWMDAVRRIPELGRVGVLIRPHFKRGAEWAELGMRALPNAVVWPPAGEVPIDARSRESYFDSLFHCAAVVGLNTSALIEGAILGKPVLTPLLPEFYGNQEGTIHFRYLSEGPSALLHTARSLDEHAQQLGRVLAGREPDHERSGRFVRHFVRPGDAGTPATHRVAAAIELAASLRPARAHGGWRIPAVLLAPLARVAVERLRRQREEHRRIDEERRAERIRQRDEKRSRKRGVRELTS
jgi:hypothetical protein